MPSSKFAINFKLVILSKVRSQTFNMYVAVFKFNLILFSAEDFLKNI